MRRIALVIAAIFPLICAPAFSQGTVPVQVLYAGSLVTPMEGPIKSALATRGIDFEGQGAGSKQLAKFIASGLKNPDIFISVDPQLVTGLGSKVLSSRTFAHTSLGLAWSDSSKYNALFQRVASGKTTALSALQTPRLRMGRTDPELDPKGVYTIDAVKILAGANGEQQILGSDSNSGQVFPEEVLLTRVETGDVDVGFFYRTEAVARNLHFVPLPGAASMSDRVSYTLAVMRDAPHPDQAKQFADFILTGEGTAILERAGLEYIPLKASQP
jgi:molybdate/tungstate transport system substrate-binding protein